MNPHALHCRQIAGSQALRKGTTSYPKGTGHIAAMWEGPLGGQMVWMAIGTLLGILGE